MLSPFSWLYLLLCLDYFEHLILYFSSCLPSDWHFPHYIFFLFTYFKVVQLFFPFLHTNLEILTCIFNLKSKIKYLLSYSNKRMNSWSSITSFLRCIIIAQNFGYILVLIPKLIVTVSYRAVYHLYFSFILLFFPFPLSSYTFFLGSFLFLELDHLALAWFWSQCEPGEVAFRDIFEYMQVLVD